MSPYSSSWVETILGEVCTFKSGNSLPEGKEFANQENGYLLLKVSDLNRTENTPVINVAGLWTDSPVAKSVSCSPGAIVLPKRGGAIATNKKRILGRPASLDPNLMGIEPSVNRLDSLYLYYWFQQFDLTQISSGSSVPQLNKQDLQPLKIPLPPIAEQKRIAAILDKAEELRGLRRQALGELDAITQSIFLEMFGDPVQNHKGWKVTKLFEVCDNITDGTHDTPTRVPSGIPFITSKNIRPFEIDLSVLEFVTQETHKEIIKRCNPRLGDILYTNIGVNVGSAVANRLPFEFSLKNVALIQPDFGKLNSFFLEMLLNYEPFKQSILNVSSTGGAQKFIALKVLRYIQVVLPPIALQQEFARRVKAIEQLKTTHRESLAQLDALFASLQHRAFRGEL